MRPTLRISLALGLALAAGLAFPAFADGFDISLSDDSAYLQYLTRAENLGQQGSDVGFGLMFTDDDDWLLSSHVLVLGPPGMLGPRVQVGAGAKAYAIDLDLADDTVFAIGIGGAVRIPLSTRTPIALAFEGYYAPDITAFSGAENVLDLTGRVEIEIGSGTRAYAGVRLIEVDGEAGGEIELDDGLIVGVRIAF